MRNVILAVSLVCLSVVATGSTIEFPHIQRIEFTDPMVIGQADAKTLCKKYMLLFMLQLHKTLECSEDYAPSYEKYEKCEEAHRLLGDYSRLRSYYCYGEEEL